MESSSSLGLCIDINEGRESERSPIYRFQVMVHDTAKSHNPQKEKRIQLPMLMMAQVEVGEDVLVTWSTSHRKEGNGNAIR
jgi:hypothetical protein